MINLWIETVYRCDKIPWLKSPWGGKGLFHLTTCTPPCREVRVGTLKVGTSHLLSLFSYTSRSLVPTGTYHGLGHPTARKCLIALPPLRWLQFVSGWQKTNKHLASTETRELFKYLIALKVIHEGPERWLRGWKFSSQLPPTPGTCTHVHTHIQHIHITENKKNKRELFNKVIHY